MDTSKNQQAAQMIVAQISKLPADKRASEAQNMALFICKKISGISLGNLYETWTPEQHAVNDNAKAIAASALEILNK